MELEPTDFSCELKKRFKNVNYTETASPKKKSASKSKENDSIGLDESHSNSSPFKESNCSLQSSKFIVTNLGELKDGMTSLAAFQQERRA